MCDVKIINNRVYAKMVKLNYTIERLSEESAVPVDTIRNIIYGRTTNPRIQTIMSLCDALDMSVYELMSRNGDASFYYNNNDDVGQLINWYNKCNIHGKKLIHMIANMEQSMSRGEIPCFTPYGSIVDGSGFSICDIKTVKCKDVNAYAAVKFNTDEFAPIFWKGDIIYLSNHFPKESEFVVFFYNDKIYFRKYSVYGDSYIFSPIGNYKDNLILRKDNMKKFNLIGTFVQVIR